MAVLKDLFEIINHSGILPPALALERLMTTGEAIDFRSHFEINECNEPLIEISGSLISCAEPHPHLSIGATYSDYSPFCVRKGVLDQLDLAAQYLAVERPGCKLHIYDAYRPLAVQRFMIDHELSKLAAACGLNADTLDETSYHSMMAEVLMVWAEPDTNLKCPPPHSTGAAVDLTIINEEGELLDMGSVIDAMGEVSLPNYFVGSSEKQEMSFHANRELLNGAMSRARFRRLPHEWWHFSFGDQVWAMLEWLDNPAKMVHAIYGRVEI